MYTALTLLALYLGYVCDVPALQCRQWSLHCDASRKGTPKGFWTRIKEMYTDKDIPSEVSVQLQRPVNVFPFTPHLDQGAIARLGTELRSDKSTLTLSLITIYPASCDVAIAGVGVVLEHFISDYTGKSFTHKLCLDTLQTVKPMRDLNILLPAGLQGTICRALMKCNRDTLDLAAYFLEHIFDLRVEADKGCYDHNGASYLRRFMEHFKMDAALVDVIINK